MLSRTEIRLISEKPLSYQMSSLFHGALLELLPEDYATFLHESTLHPYAQHLERRENEWYWIVNALNEDAYENIIGILERTDRLEIKKHDMTVALLKDKRKELTDEELTNIFYNGQGTRYFNLCFRTPTAFKRNGEYLFYPDRYCIFQSLMNKHDGIYGSGLRDEDALAELVGNSKITRYQLKSTFFELEGVKIPSFIGSITIKIGGTVTMRNLAEMLLRFGEFSGIGIKTAIGMGAVEIIENKERRRVDQHE